MPIFIPHSALRTPHLSGLWAFTLVELLVVVSIIALLISILLPALRKAREQAKLTVCLANMSNLGKSSLTYAADDSSEHIIPVPLIEALPDAPGNFEWGGKAGIGQPTQAGDVTTSLWGTAVWRGPAHRPLNRYLYKAGFRDWNPVSGTAQPGASNVNFLNDTKLDLPLFRCPSDMGYAGGGFYYYGNRHRDYSEYPYFRDPNRTSAYDFYGNSYVANCYWVGVGTAGSGNRLTSNSPYLQPSSRIPSPGNTLIYLEMPARCVWLWGEWGTDSGCQWTNRFSLCVGNYKTVPGWHRRDFNFSTTFADGHAAMVEMKGCQRPPPNLGLANYPASNGCNNNPYECNRCITVRGPGWQMDTLPAPGVLTNWTN